MIEIEQIIEDEIAITDNEGNQFVNVKRLAKAIEQYVIKARIEEYEYMKSEQFVYGGVTYSERIAELKKGIDNG